MTATLDAAIADPEVAASLGTLVRAAHWAGFGLARAPPPSAPHRRAPPPRRPHDQENPPPTRLRPSAERERRRREKIIWPNGPWLKPTRPLKPPTRPNKHLEDTVRRLEAELAEARQRLAEAQAAVLPGRVQAAAGERRLGRLERVNLPGPASGSYTHVGR